MGDALLFQPLDSPGPNPGQPITQQVYRGVLAATLKEGQDRNGLYRTNLGEFTNLQTVALMLPAGMAWVPTPIGGAVTDE